MDQEPQQAAAARRPSGSLTLFSTLTSIFMTLLKVFTEVLETRRQDQLIQAGADRAAAQSAAADRNNKAQSHELDEMAGGGELSSLRERMSKYRRGG